MDIRPFQPDDFESLYALEELCFTAPLRFDREYMLKILTQPESINHLVVDSSGVVAFIVGSLHQKTAVRAVYIETIEVHPEHRRRGYAYKLLAELEASARACLATQLWLHVDAANTTAIKIYERLDFVQHKFIDHFYPSGGAAYLYRKNIETQ